MARMNVYFPNEKDKERLYRLAVKLGISPSRVVRLALDKFYEKHKHEEKVEKHG